MRELEVNLSELPLAPLDRSHVTPHSSELAKFRASVLAHFRSVSVIMTHDISHASRDDS